MFRNFVPPTNPTQRTAMLPLCTIWDCSLTSAQPRFVRLQHLCKRHVGCCQRAPLVVLPGLLLPPLLQLAHTTTCPRTPPVLLLLARALLRTLDVVGVEPASATSFPAGTYLREYSVYVLLRLWRATRCLFLAEANDLSSTIRDTTIWQNEGISIKYLSLELPAAVIVYFWGTVTIGRRPAKSTSGESKGFFSFHIHAFEVRRVRGFTSEAQSSKLRFGSHLVSIARWWPLILAGYVWCSRMNDAMNVGFLGGGWISEGRMEKEKRVCGRSER